MKITSAMLKGMTVKQVMSWVELREKEGKMDQKQHDKVVKYLKNLAAGKILTDQDLNDTVLKDLNG
ncbi:hypothetical protein [Mesorhizobium sp.]|uniref:hypothetical protein n=1 Tax=Mesorhizobium sp. TaxID=1871066 RepID=UPI0011F9DA96|nr:hypothetical protein [Mesorhizobium sp.]TIN24753.1 MAG: hypothetical protein E5Y19_21540 [Mesorhizobium sp.]TIN42939.1 MAG: hypothetical protein E5Y13_04010 [Mesorhizobium sp.]TJU87906.1 MAG: hypothetical protein E5Y15_05215 [Mesorhizobium sp.]TJU91867.1 MAG: hypothetical protein E5Y10_04670 [Mesorhizobium sp.]